MGFEVAGDAYDRYIGRYSRQIAPLFIDFAGVTRGPALDVGCGPGSLTAALAERLGAAQVAAVDPSEAFVAACRARVPGADVRRAPGEKLPFEEARFEAALSQLVLSFVREPGRMAAELRRVLRPGGIAAACTFEAEGFALVRTFWQAALRFDPSAPDDSRIPFRRMPELLALWQGAGFREIETGIIDVTAAYAGFDDLWSPFAFGIGPAGEWLKQQPPERKQALREACFEILGKPAGPFSLPARVLAVRGRV